MAKEQTTKLIEAVRTMALAAIGLDPQEREAFVERVVAMIQRKYEQTYGSNPAAAEQAARLLVLSKEMVRILEQPGGSQVGHA